MKKKKGGKKIVSIVVSVSMLVVVAVQLRFISIGIITNLPPPPDTMHRTLILVVLVVTTKEVGVSEAAAAAAAATAAVLNVLINSKFRTLYYSKTFFTTHFDNSRQFVSIYLRSNVKMRSVQSSAHHKRFIRLQWTVSVRRSKRKISSFL